MVSRPPLPADELEELARDVDQRWQPEPTSRANAVPNAHLSLTRLSDVHMRSIRYVRRALWHGGAFQLLAARKGMGKGTYLAWLAARMSRGELDDDIPRAVIFIAASEDSLEIDLKPRLIAAGVEEQRVSVI